MVLKLRVVLLEVISETGLGQAHLQHSDNQVNASPMIPSGARVSSLADDGSGGCDRCVITLDVCRQFRRPELA